MIIEVSIAAATATVGYDLLKDSDYQNVGYPRSVIGIGVKGSTAGGDTEVEIFIDQTKYGSVFNTNTGFPNMDDVKPIGPIPVYGNQDIRAKVVDAPATNPINILVVTSP